MRILAETSKQHFMARKREATADQDMENEFYDGNYT